jgi:hypothetical protein
VNSQSEMIFMKKLFGVIVCASLVCMSLAQQPADRIILQAKLLPHLNPTNYEFDANIAEVKSSISNAFGNGWQKELAAKNKGVVWKGSGDDHSRLLLSRALQEPMPRLFWKGQADALTKGFLTKSGNENDAYIYNSDAPVESTVYFKDGQPLIYYADFQIHLAAIDQHKTRVEIFTYDSNVGVGIDERWSPHGPRLIRVAVKPTTVEEFQILLRIGEKLGFKNMSPLVTPQLDSPTRQFTMPRQS